MIAILQLIINNGASILPSLKKVILGEAQNYPRSIPGRISSFSQKRDFTHFFLIMEGIL